MKKKKTVANCNFPHCTIELVSILWLYRRETFCKKSSLTRLQARKNSHVKIQERFKDFINFIQIQYHASLI